MTEPMLVSVPEAGKLLGIGKDLAWELIHDGELPSVHIHRRVLVRVSDLRRYVDELQLEPGNEGEDDRRGGLAVVTGRGGRGTGRPR